MTTFTYSLILFNIWPIYCKYLHFVISNSIMHHMNILMMSIIVDQCNDMECHPTETTICTEHHAVT